MAQAILNLRMLALSGRWAEYWAQQRLPHLGVQEEAAWQFPRPVCGSHPRDLDPHATRIPHLERARVGGIRGYIPELVKPRRAEDQY